jgi:hypothetical protein
MVIVREILDSGCLGAAALVEGGAYAVIVGD